MKFVVSHAIKENTRRKLYYFICLFACFLVTLVCFISKSIVTQGSIIFLMLAERDMGEMDIILKPKVKIRGRYNKTNPEDFFMDYAFINYSNFEEVLNKENNNIKIIENEYEDPLNLNKNPLETSTIRVSYNGTITNSNNKMIEVIAINTTKEKEIELGRNYPFSKMNKGECIPHKRLAFYAKNNILSLNVNFDTLIYNTLLMRYYKGKGNYDKNLDFLNKTSTWIKFECKIVNTFDDNYGKYVGDDENLIFMELEYFYETIAENLNEDLNKFGLDYQNFLKNINPKNYGTRLIVNFPKNRINYYLESDYNVLLENGVKFGNKLVRQMNSFEHILVDMPIINSLYYYNYGLVLLNLILNIIIISLFILSLILIYSLLLITTETNSFEFGILRLIGTTKMEIILIVVLQCISFSLPAFFLAYFAQFGIINIINIEIRNYIKTDLNLSYSKNSLVLAIIVNFLSPICAAIFPIKNILSKNIALSVNSKFTSMTGMKIEVLSLEEKEKKNLIIFGLISFLYGAMIYYFLPLSMISLNYGMLGGIFLWILFGILLGFVILSMNAEALIQRLVTYILFLPVKSYTKNAIVSNLTAHRIKNRKTSLMFSLSVGIFIMISVGLDLIVQSTTKSSILLMGSEVLINPYPANNYFTPKQVKNTLKVLFEENVIESFSFKSPSLDKFTNDLNVTTVNPGKNLYYEVLLIAVTPSYFNSTDSENLKVSSQNKSNSMFNPSEQIYLLENVGKSGISGYFSWYFKANLNDYFYLVFTKKNNQFSLMTKPSVIFDNAGGIQMNSQPSYWVIRNNLMSIPTYIDLLNKCNRYFTESVDDLKTFSIDDFPIEAINLKINPKMNIKNAINIISSVISKDNNYSAELWLFNNRKERLNTISNIVYNIFYTVSTIVLFFCFFNLTASMTINIFDQKKEIAILRALGMPKEKILFIFVAEAIVLILTSSLIGTIIGSLISYTMNLQWQVFNNINIGFSIKFSSLLLIIIFSIIGGLLSTVIPAKKMLNESISELIRNSY